MMGSAATSMSTIFNKKVDISPPTIELLDVTKGEGEDTIPNEDLMVKISFRLRVGDLIDSNIMQLLPLTFAKELVRIISGMQDDATEQQLQRRWQKSTLSTAKLQQYTAINHSTIRMQQPIMTTDPNSSNQCISNHATIISNATVSRLQMNHNILINAIATCKCSTGSIYKLSST